jgi:hypothetical protein
MTTPATANAAAVMITDNSVSSRVFMSSRERREHSQGFDRHPEDHIGFVRQMYAYSPGSHEDE